MTCDGETGDKPAAPVIGPAGTVDETTDLPHYAVLLAARHAAHRKELCRLLAENWDGQSLKILDVACGDGFYTAAFSDILCPPSEIVAVDVSPTFLHWSASRGDLLQRAGVAVSFVEADAARLPFPDGYFDVAWCAQSLISLPDPAAALREMRRVVRSGGAVAVLENDPIHELQMPWPVDLELAIRTAERQFWADRQDRQSVDAGRTLADRLIEAGLRPARQRHLSIDRTAPLSSDDAMFLKEYLAALADRVAGWLEPPIAAEFQRLLSPSSPDYLPSGPSFWMVWHDLICVSERD